MLDPINEDNQNRERRKMPNFSLFHRREESSFKTEVSILYFWDGPHVILQTFVEL